MVLQTQGLTKRYGDFFALRDVSVTVRKGDVYGLVGRNGAGKTTFVKCVLGLARPSAGTVELGEGPQRPDKARQQVGFMMTPSFFPYLAARENLVYLCRAKGVSEAREVDRLLDLVGLSEVRKPFSTFSLGMRQRLGIAGALLGSPSLVILDEPINGLDPQGIIDVRAIIASAREERGVTFIVSSHILSELDLVATRFGFIEQGSLVSEISHQELHEQTGGALVVEVDDVARARALLEARKLIVSSASENRLVLRAAHERSAEVARALVEGGVDLYDLHRRETTLEEYFARVTKGAQND